MKNTVLNHNLFWEERKNREFMISPQLPLGRSPRKIKIHVYRNHSFELVARSMRAPLLFAEYEADFSYSDYDDTLGFRELDRVDADLLIIWLDLSRYSNSEYKEFISGRLAVAQAMFLKPILVVTVLGDIGELDTRINHVSFRNLESELGNSFIEPRFEKVSGTKLSVLAQTSIAFDLGTMYVPALLGKQIRTVIVDLDNTLYSGVLGEDGIEGVILSPQHKSLQQELKNLQELGVLLALASKNDLRDVSQLFEERDDFPLKYGDFLLVKADWSPKSEILDLLESTSNITSEHYLFLDDNLGELSQIHDADSSIKLLHATNPEETLYRLLHFPGVFRFPSSSRENDLRLGDLKANSERKELKARLKPTEYLRDLNVVLGISIDNPDTAQRLSELSCKTNQFIFSYLRLAEGEVMEKIKSEGNMVLAITMKDRFSDSGIIAGVFVNLEGETAIVEEMFVSCRALGRGLEESILFEPLRIALRSHKATKLEVRFRDGERNLPAKNFYADFLSGSVIETLQSWRSPDEVKLEVQGEQSND